MTDGVFSDKEKELQWLNSGRVTTDTVHRRFQKPDSKNDTRKEPNTALAARANYFCLECRCEIISTNGIISLKEHFDLFRHKHYENCVYCSKPAYFYKYKGKLEVYHNC